MARFRDINPDLEATMKTHLIDNLDRFGVWNDDYDRFFDERAKAVSRELSKRIIRRDIDNQGQANIVNDSEPESIP